MKGKQQAIGITLDKKQGQSSVPVFHDENGVDTFESNEPYLLPDGKSLADPIPVVVSDGPIWHDENGSAFSAMGIKSVPDPAPPPEPIPEHTLGPQDIVIDETGLVSLDGEFDLASHNMTLGVVCYVDGPLSAGEIQATHGGEPLTLARIDINSSGLFTAVFYGNGLTIETAQLSVFTTSETAKLGPAIMRMRDDLGYVGDIEKAWSDGAVAYANRTREITTQCPPTGVVLAACGVRSFREGADINQIGAVTPMVTGLSGRVLHGELEELDYQSFSSEFWVQSEPGVFTLDDAGADRDMTIDVDIDPNTNTGLRLDYTSDTSNISVFYMRPNGSFVNMAARSGVDRRWYLPIPASATGYVRLRFVASDSAVIKDIKLIKDPIGVYGRLTMTRGAGVGNGWKMYGSTLNTSPISISCFSVDGSE